MTHAPDDTRLPAKVLRAIQDYAYALEMENRAAQRERYALFRTAIREALDKVRNEYKVCVCHIPSPDPCPRHP